MERPEAVKPKDTTEWDRFEAFAKRLLAVPAEEIRDERAVREDEKDLRRCRDRAPQT
jgi:hypothetical protein